ncbi:MAG: PEGA domain-containing protein, partial [Vicinamibacteria bacterium]|nr:PEGA domain-containing protein [Vicinamibacteria bacterium]
IMRAEAETSQAEPQKGAQPVQVGDKAILLPRALEASFDAAVMLKVQAGKEGAEVPFADVNVYRNGVWVGITSDEGELKVPVQTGEKYTFLLVRGGVKPYQVEIQPTQPFEPKTVLVPASMCHVRFESEPSNARLLVDGKEMGSTPLEIDVLMGFRRIRAEAGGDWRAYDEVKEFTKIEEDYTGARKLVLRKDLLKQADNLMAKGDVDGAITALSGAERGHPDYSAIHNRLASIYLDRKKNPQKAIEEFEKVLTLPENAELINKRFTVVFLNEGRAYYMLGTRDGYVKAIARLKTARDNKRFFPQDDFDRATHYTLYYLALATHKLYYLEPGDRLLQEVGTCWKNYFDFFPASLRDDQDILEARTSAEQFSEEIRRKLKEQ